ncbi:MAG TPA: DUF177 domain-containing protein [bacterium]|nr:DUF177 domain-containing protein [bacterium]
MIINLKLLESGKQESIEYSNIFSIAEIPFEDTGLDFIEDFAIEYTVEKVGGDYSIIGKYQTKVKFPCDKCLSTFDYIIKDNFSFIVMKEKENDDELKDEDDIIVISDADYELDITDYIRENILVSLSYINKCSEDCKGLCSVCGANLNKETCSCKNEYINPAFNKLLQNFKD